MVEARLKQVEDFLWKERTNDFEILLMLEWFLFVEMNDTCTGTGTQGDYTGHCIVVNLIQQNESIIIVAKMFLVYFH